MWVTTLVHRIVIPNSQYQFEFVFSLLLPPALFHHPALRRLRASSNVEEDIEEMRAEERAQQAESHISTMELICSPTLRAPLIIAIVMQLSQQLSGINAVFYYSTTLFMSSGLTEESAKYATIGIGCIMVSGGSVFRAIEIVRLFQFGIDR